MHGERTKYQLTAVAGTNVFVAWLNATGDGGAAFCPCSTLDRICLNCNRMEPTNCECPCECPLNVHYAEDDANNNNDMDDNVAHLKRTIAKNDAALANNAALDANLLPEMTLRHHADICSPTPSAAAAFGDAARTPHLDTWALTADADLQQCVDRNCEQYAVQLDCLGVQGCEWCQVDVDAETYFAVPFCTQSSACYTGVLGAESPYGNDVDLGSAMADAMTPAMGYSVVGPVIGALIALGVVIGVAMFCYRQTYDGHTDALYNSAQETSPFGMPLQRFDFDDNGGRPPDGGGGGGDGNGGPGGDGSGPGAGGAGDGDLGGTGADKQVAMISPYRVLAGTYRAPTTHTESDHGYSTMTPREDSEHQCFALAEPLLRGNVPNGAGSGRRPGRASSSVSDAGSLDTSVSSPANHNQCYDKSNSSSNSSSAAASGFSPRIDTKAIDPSVTQLMSGGGGGRSPHHVQAKVTVHRPMEMF